MNLKLSEKNWIEEICFPQKADICEMWCNLGDIDLTISQNTFTMRLHLCFFSHPTPTPCITFFSFDNHSLSIEPTNNKHCHSGISQRKHYHIRDYSIYSKWNSTDFAGHIALPNPLSTILIMPDRAWVLRRISQTCKFANHFFPQR